MGLGQVRDLQSPPSFKAEAHNDAEPFFGLKARTQIVMRTLFSVQRLRGSRYRYIVNEDTLS